MNLISAALAAMLLPSILVPATASIRQEDNTDCLEFYYLGGKKYCLERSKQNVEFELAAPSEEVRETLLNELQKAGIEAKLITFDREEKAVLYAVVPPNETAERVRALVSEIFEKTAAVKP